MLTILETLSQIHDHHTELLLEPVHLLLLGNSKTLNTSMSILVLFESYSHKECNAYYMEDLKPDP